MDLILHLGYILIISHLSHAMLQHESVDLLHELYPTPMRGIHQIHKDDIDPCGASGRKPIGKVSDRCAVTTTRVFSNRLSFKRFMKRRKHRRSISLTKLRAKMNLAESKYYNESLVERSKRNTRTLLAVSTDGLWPKWCVMVAFFRVFSQDFTLCLQKQLMVSDPIVNTSYPDIGVTIIGDSLENNGEKSYQKLGKRGLSTVSGHVMGKPYSSVHGYVRKNRFYGSIYVKGMIMFVEPIVTKGQIRFTLPKSKRKRRSVNAYIYKFYHRPMERFKDKKNLIYLNGVERSQRKELNCRSCGLMLMADYEFYRDVGEESVQKDCSCNAIPCKRSQSDVKKAGFQQRLGKIPDCLGVHITGIRVFTSAEVNFKEKGDFERGHKLTNYWTWDGKSNGTEKPLDDLLSAEDYLKQFSRSRLDKHCLGILFSNKVFASRVLGLAWKGDPKKQSGICQKRRKDVAFKNSKDTLDLNLNTLFVTLRTKDMDRIPLRMVVLNLLHEILHSFGASHDVEDEDNSRESDDRYLMSRFSNTGVHFKHSKLSNRTKESVNETLGHSKMSDCLVSMVDPEMCGDGIIQGDEECDCGSVEMCLSTRSCCIQAGGGPRRQSECTWSVPRQIFGSCFK